MTSKTAMPRILLAVPIGIWCFHIFVIVPALGTLSGEAKFHTAMYFFAAAAIAMIVCEILAINQFRQLNDGLSLLAIVLNWTWLYYIKVFVLGPSIGDL